ncbi:MAG: ABC transporter substrate-binding protein [Pseudomonadota bacterium]
MTQSSKFVEKPTFISLCGLKISFSGTRLAYFANFLDGWFVANMLILAVFRTKGRKQKMCRICGNDWSGDLSRRRVLGMFGAAAAAGVAGSALWSRSSSAAELTKISIGDLVQAGAHSAGMKAGQRPEVASKFGLIIEPRQYNAGANLVQALASGDIVAGVCGCTPAIMARAQGVKLKIVANSNREGSSLIGRQEIKSAAELDGKTVATPNIASVQEAVMRQYEQKLGIKTKRAFVKATDMPIMLRNKEIDAYIVWESTATAGLAVSTGKILATSKDMAPNHECCSLIVAEDFLNKQPQQAKQLINTFAEGRKQISNDQALLTKMVAEADGVSPEIAAQALKNVAYTKATNNIDELVRLTESLMSTGTIEKGKISDPSAFVKDLVDNSVIAAA